MNDRGRPYPGAAETGLADQTCTYCISIYAAPVHLVIDWSKKMSNASQGGKTYLQNPIHPRFSGRPNTTQSIAKQNTKKSRLDYKGGRIETAFWSAWDKNQVVDSTIESVDCLPELNLT